MATMNFKNDDFLDIPVGGVGGRENDNTQPFLVPHQPQSRRKMILRKHGWTIYFACLSFILTGLILTYITMKITWGYNVTDYMAEESATNTERIFQRVKPSSQPKNVDNIGDGLNDSFNSSYTWLRENPKTPSPSYSLTSTRINIKFYFPDSPSSKPSQQSSIAPSLSSSIFPSLYPTKYSSLTPSRGSSVHPSRFSSTNPSAHSSEALSNFPTNAFDDELEHILEITYNKSSLMDEHSPQMKALYWLNESIPSIMIPANSNITILNLRQKFVLATLYYSTNGPSWLNSSSYRWLASHSECSWGGIRCVNESIASISLKRSNLEGTLPPELAKLPQLKSLSMRHNRLKGTIPSSIFASMRNLEKMYLSNNDLSGQLPFFMSNLQNLVHLDISTNSLSGKLPDDICRMKRLETIKVTRNLFQSTLPENIGNLTSLREAYFGHNGFSGTVPKSIGRLKSLETLYLNENYFNGTIPSEFRSMESLVDLNLELNMFEGNNSHEVCNVLPNLKFFNGELCINKNVSTASNTSTPSFLTTYPPSNSLSNGSGLSSNDSPTFSPSPTSDYSSSSSMYPSEEQTFYPTGMFHEYNSVRDLVYDIQTLDEPGTPQYQAMQWLNGSLVNLQIPPRSNITIDELKQKFILATLYFSTNGTGWESSSRFRWRSKFSTCSWHGVYCLNNTIITSIDLKRSNLVGTIPHELAKLPNLKMLSLSHNFLRGTIPSVFFTHMDRIESMLLHNCQLIGDLPPIMMWNLPNLKEVDLSHNLLTGKLPNAIVGVRTLEKIKLTENQFQSTLPYHIGNMTSLRELHLGSNDFVGPIPKSIGNLNSLEALHLYENKLTGTLPLDLGKLRRLVELSLAGNKLEGKLSEEVCSLLPNLRFYDGALFSGVRCIGLTPVPSVSGSPSSNSSQRLETNLTTQTPSIYFQKPYLNATIYPSAEYSPTVFPSTYQDTFSPSFVNRSALISYSPSSEDSNSTLISTTSNGTSPNPSFFSPHSAIPTSNVSDMASASPSYNASWTSNHNVNVSMKPSWNASLVPVKNSTEGNATSAVGTSQNNTEIIEESMSPSLFNYSLLQPNTTKSVNTNIPSAYIGPALFLSPSMSPSSFNGTSFQNASNITNTFVIENSNSQLSESTNNVTLTTATFANTSSSSPSIVVVSTAAPSSPSTNASVPTTSNIFPLFGNNQSSASFFNFTVNSSSPVKFLSGTQTVIVNTTSAEVHNETSINIGGPFHTNTSVPLHNSSATAMPSFTMIHVNKTSSLVPSSWMVINASFFGPTIMPKNSTTTLLSTSKPSVTQSSSSNLTTPQPSLVASSKSSIFMLPSNMTNVPTSNASFLGVAAVTSNTPSSRVQARNVTTLSSLLPTLPKSTIYFPSVYPSSGNASLLENSAIPNVTSQPYSIGTSLPSGIPTVFYSFNSSLSGSIATSNNSSSTGMVDMPTISPKSNVTFQSSFETPSFVSSMSPTLSITYLPSFSVSRVGTTPSSKMPSSTNITSILEQMNSMTFVPSSFDSSLSSAKPSTYSPTYYANSDLPSIISQLRNVTHSPSLNTSIPGLSTWSEMPSIRNMTSARQINNLTSIPSSFPTSLSSVMSYFPSSNGSFSGTMFSTNMNPSGQEENVTSVPSSFNTSLPSDMSYFPSSNGSFSGTMFLTNMNPSDQKEKVTSTPSSFNTSLHSEMSYFPSIYPSFLGTKTTSTDMPSIHQAKNVTSVPSSFNTSLPSEMSYFPSIYPSSLGTKTTSTDMPSILQVKNVTSVPSSFNTSLPSEMSYFPSIYPSSLGLTSSSTYFPSSLEIKNMTSPPASFDTSLPSVMTHFPTTIATFASTPSSTDEHSNIQLNNVTSSPSFLDTLLLSTKSQFPSITSTFAETARSSGNITTNDKTVNSEGISGPPSTMVNFVSSYPTSTVMITPTTPENVTSSFFPFIVSEVESPSLALAVPSSRPLLSNQESAADGPRRRGPRRLTQTISRQVSARGRSLKNEINTEENEHGVKNIRKGSVFPFELV